MIYAKHLSGSAHTPQSQPILGSNQVKNSTGAYSFPVDDWIRLDRFLILGNEGGSFYAGERQLTSENASAVVRCIQADEQRTLKRIVEISDSGRAPKNEPAILALALAFAYGNPETRRAAESALIKVCRTGTHLFHFAAYINQMRGWGRGLRRAVGSWYTQATPTHLALQAVKYQQRDGWSHRDLLRLSHPKTTSDAQRIIFDWIVRGWSSVGELPHPIKAIQMIWAYERAKVVNKDELIGLITNYRLPREAIPTQWLTDPDVWAALLPHLGITAILRNLGNMTRVGFLKHDQSDAVYYIRRLLKSSQILHRARIHPIVLLSALLTYSQGTGVKGNGTWKPVTRLINTLDKAFYLSFNTVKPTARRIVLALDVSGSMDGGVVAGVPGLTPRLASGALALVTAATEAKHHIVAFSHTMVPVNISPRQRLDEMVQRLRDVPMGGTDCALPMLWALNNKVEVDAFVIYTDSETWYGAIHPVQALQHYRQQMNIPAKLVVVGMISNGFTIADPADAGMLDVVGFDAATPQVINDFIRDM
jgi:60 kDa SS-A/Ro ribonucleoprotein